METPGNGLKIVPGFLLSNVHLKNAFVSERIYVYVYIYIKKFLRTKAVLNILAICLFLNYLVISL